jgi:phosphatidyl-myo-inositol dimannoside synthase
MVELARLGNGRWEFTAVAPSKFVADLGPMLLERDAEHSKYFLEPVDVILSRHIHIFHYGRRLREILRQKWDLIHAWEEPYIVAGAQLAHWAPRDSRLIFASAQNIAKRYPLPWRWLEHFSMSRAAGLVAWGHSVASALETRAPYRGKPLRVVPLGVEIAQFRPDTSARAAGRLALEWPLSGPPVVGFVGRFVQEKGLRVLMDALDRLSLPWRALFVGGGPLERELRGWAAKRPADVRVVTGISHSGVPRFLNTMDILCAPSLTISTWREQFGRMIIEGFACGLPVIGSDSGEIPFTLGDAGMLVAESDSMGWTSAIAALLESPAKRREYGAAGLARVRDNFTWEVVARKHLAFFQEILDIGGPKQSV